MNHPQSALRILPFIGELGRFDYVLVGMNTPIEDDVVELIRNQIESDLKSETPSLLAKWLPSHRTHNENNMLAKRLIKKLGITEKEYRKTLSALRIRLNIVERNLSDKTYENIDFSKVPAKAMLKYTDAYARHMSEVYSNYKESVMKGETKVNTSGLFAYEIVKKIHWGIPVDEEFYDLMWKNQKDVLKGIDTNVLVMADTSGSMMSYDGIPYATSVGMAIYTAERNTGIFQNHFITFSSEPTLCEVKGATISDKVNNIPRIIANTDIDKAFKLILDTAVENEIKQEELPSHLLIISDMEFDESVYTESGTNFSGWKKAFKEAGYKLPTVIFWNVAAFTQGVPTSKFENDVCMVSGFSTNILENLLSLKEYTPMNAMMDKLSIYLEMLGDK